MAENHNIASAYGGLLLLQGHLDLMAEGCLASVHSQQLDALTSCCSCDLLSFCWQWKPLDDFDHSR